MPNNGTLFIISSIVLIIGIAFVAITQYLSKYRQRLTGSSVSCPPGEIEESETEDKRLLERISLKWPVVLEKDDEKTETQTTNICISGAFILHSSPLDIGERFNITLNIPEHPEITLEGEVVWNNSNVPEDKVVSRGMGIRFIRLSRENREKLNQILDVSRKKEQVD